MLFVAGQIGWNEREEMASDDVVGQFRQALANVLTIVETAGGTAQHLVRLTIYCTDVDAYRNGVKDIGAAYRSILGKHFPAMALVGVTELVHPLAKVEIEATAVLEAT